MSEDDTFIIKGLSPLGPIPEVSVGRLIYDKLVATCEDDTGLREAFIDASTEKAISYKELLGRTCTLAEALRSSGCDENTMISICSENCIEFFIPVLAAVYMGATVAPINHTYTKHELIHALNISKPRIIFCSQNVYSKLLIVKTELDFVKHIIIIDLENAAEGVDTMNTFINKILGKPCTFFFEFELRDLNVDEHVAFILYSSGTTGLPKGVMVTHKNIVANFMNGSDPRLINPDRGDSLIGFLPFYHAYGLFVSIGSIFVNRKVIVMKNFEENLFLRVIEKYKIRGLLLVPSLAVLLAKSPLVDRYDLSSVKEVGCGAAPLAKEIEEKLKKRLNITTFRQGYGLTESTLSLMMVPFGETKHGSSGKLLPSITCKVRDSKTGKSLGPYQVGELCFKGPVIMKGYYGNEEATKNTFTSDGWLLTGDLGYYDEDEYFYITGRLKELVKYKGFQVAPAELEAILLSNPKIQDAAVVGLPDENAGELPLAFVVRSSNSELTEEEVKQFLHEKVSPHKRLRGGVIFVSEIPRTTSGKILRRELREMLEKYIPKSKL